MLLPPQNGSAATDCVIAHPRDHMLSGCGRRHSRPQPASCIEGRVGAGAVACASGSTRYRALGLSLYSEAFRAYRCSTSTFSCSRSPPGTGPLDALGSIRYRAQGLSPSPKALHVHRPSGSQRHSFTSPCAVVVVRAPLQSAIASLSRITCAHRGGCPTIELVGWGWVLNRRAVGSGWW